MKTFLVTLFLTMLPTWAQAQSTGSDDARGYERSPVRMPWTPERYGISKEDNKKQHVDCPVLPRTPNDQAVALEVVLDSPITFESAPELRVCLPIAEKLSASGTVDFANVKKLSDVVTKVKDGLKVRSAIGSCVSGIDVESKGKILDALAVVKANGDSSKWIPSNDAQAYENLKERLYIESVKNALDQYYILGKKYGSGLESSDPIKEICRTGCTASAKKALTARLAELQRATVPNISFAQTAAELNDSLTKELSPAAIAYNRSTSVQSYGNFDPDGSARMPAISHALDPVTKKPVGPQTKEEAEAHSASLYSRYRSTYWHIAESEHGILLRTNALEPLAKVEPKPNGFMSDAWRFVAEKPQIPTDPNYIRRAVMDAKAMIAEQTGHLNDLMKNGSHTSSDLLTDLAKLTKTNPAAAAQVMINNPELSSNFCPILTQASVLSAKDEKSKFWWSMAFLAGGTVVSLILPPVGGAIIGATLTAAPLVVEANEAYSNYKFASSAFFVTKDSANALEGELEREKFVNASIGAAAAAGSSFLFAGLLAKAKTPLQLANTKQAMVNVARASEETGGALTKVLLSVDEIDARTLVLGESEAGLKELTKNVEKNPSKWRQILERLKRWRKTKICGGTL